MTEQIIRLSDLESVLSGAAALQTKSLNAGAVREVIEAQEIEDLPLSAVYELAEDVLRLPRQYIDSYLRMRYPSNDEVIRDLKEHGVTPRVDRVAETYRTVLLNDLVSSLPTHIFRANWSNEFHPDLYFNMFRQIDEKKGWIRKKIEKKLVHDCSLAQLNFRGESAGNAPIGKFNLKVTLMDPLFLRICGKNLERLNKEFREIMNDYSIQYAYKSDPNHSWVNR